MYYYSNFTKVCSWGSNWQQIDIGSGNSLVSNRQQAFIWTNDDPLNCFIYSFMWWIDQRNMTMYLHFTSFGHSEVVQIVEIFPCGRQGRGHFKNTYELLNPRALKISALYKYCIFQCMGKIFCVEFQRSPLKFHIKYLTHALKDVHFIHRWKFKSWALRWPGNTKRQVISGKAIDLALLEDSGFSMYRLEALTPDDAIMHGRCESPFGSCNGLLPGDIKSLPDPIFDILILRNTFQWKWPHY